MKPAARIQASIDVLADILARQRPAAQALTDWGRSHRFAGSGDRAAIGNLVYDVMRHRASAGHLMGEDSARALALGSMKLAWDESAEAIAALADGSQHAPAALSDAERAALSGVLLADAPDHVRGDFPAWLAPSVSRAFGDAAVDEARALAQRAPLDLRVNTLKTTRGEGFAALSDKGARPTLLSPVGLRIAPPATTGRTPNVETEAAFAKGWFEVQDEGSQVAALLAGARPGMQVVDVCAGAGGKTLALSAAMNNEGRIFAYDVEPKRLRPIHDRMRRAGACNIEVLGAGVAGQLTELHARMDLVLVDAPCTGSGTWRRTPDTKWRLTPAQLEERCAQQRSVLVMAAPLVRPGGRLVYITCSILPEENADQVTAFVAAHPRFRVRPFAQEWAGSIGGPAPHSADQRTETLQITPRSHGTDAFFVAVMERFA